MRQPPLTLTPPAARRLAAAQARAAEATARQTDLPGATANASSARAAVAEPAAETTARAEQGVVEAMDDRPPPSPEIEALCERMRRIIRERRPPDEESLVSAQPDEMAREAGGSVSGAVQGDASRVSGSYDAMEHPPAETPASAPTALPAEAGAAPAGDLGASGAAPEPVTRRDVSLDADVASTRGEMDRAGMNTEAAQLVESGPVAEARQAQGELAQSAREDPAEVLRRQQEALTRARSDMSALQDRARAALQSARQGTTQSSARQQRGMVRSEGDARTRAGNEAQRIFDEAQRQVDELITPLPDTAMARWEAGVNRFSTRFRDRLARVRTWIDERHSGIGGAIVAIGDWLTGLPDWVTTEYDAAEAQFADDTCDLIRDISRDVNAVVAAAQAIIQGARERIAALYAQLPADLQGWAAEQQRQFGQRLDGLSQRVSQARDGFNRDLAQRASHAVQEVREQIQQLRDAAGGLAGRVRNAVNRFLQDPARFIINGLLELLGIPPSAFWQVVSRIQSVIRQIADDPMRFARGLLAGVGQGFRQFFDHIGRHLLQGLLNWLFSALPPEAGVTVPRDFSLRSVITFFLQLMGITWARTRRILVDLVGERNVAIAERAFGLLSTLIERGPEGLFEMLREQLNPQSILDEVMRAAIQYVTQAVIERVAARIALLFNPAGAVLQAIEAIYRVLSWIFRNAARIFRLVEAVVNGVYDMLAGRYDAVANMVERALAMLIPPVIDFLAGYLGFSGLPQRVAQVVGRLQARVESIMRRVLTFLVERARALLARMGIQTGRQQPGQTPDQVGETVTFSGGGHSHRLYFRVNGSGADPMVASTPTTVSQRLQLFRSRLNDEITDASRRTLAQDLIGRAEAMTSQADADADQLVRRIRAQSAATPTATSAPPSNPAPPADNAENRALTDEERRLADILHQLYELFGESPGDRNLRARATYSGTAGSGELSFLMANTAAGLRSRVVASGPVATFSGGATFGNPPRLATSMDELRSRATSAAQRLGAARTNQLPAQSTAVSDSAIAAERAGDAALATSPVPPTAAAGPLATAATATSAVADFRLVGPGGILERATTQLMDWVLANHPYTRTAFHVLRRTAVDFPNTFRNAVTQRAPITERTLAPGIPLSAPSDQSTAVVVGKQTRRAREMPSAGRSPQLEEPAVGAYAAVLAALRQIGLDTVDGVLARLVGVDYRVPPRSVQVNIRSAKRAESRDVNDVIIDVNVLLQVEMVRAASAFTFALVAFSAPVIGASATGVTTEFAALFPHHAGGFVEDYERRGAALYDEHARRVIDLMVADERRRIGAQQLLLSRTDIEAATTALFEALRDRFSQTLQRYRGAT